MAEQNRSTLKRFFKEGALPSADNFADLIDSNLNMVDEGFKKSPEQGFEISLIGDHDRLISFFRNSADHQQAVWSISYDKDTDRLRFVKPAQAETPPALVLDPGGRVGVNTDRPRWDLDVKGVIAAEGRLGGNPGPNTVPADGEWHDVTPSLSGCQGFEVMAGVGNRGTGKYALMQAVALNAFNPSGWFFNLFRRKNRIRINQSYYLSRGHRIKLRWSGKPDDYRLQMATHCDYGEAIRIRFYLTRLWFDPSMQESWGAADEDMPEQGDGEA